MIRFVLATALIYILPKCCSVTSKFNYSSIYNLPTFTDPLQLTILNEPSIRNPFDFTISFKLLRSIKSDEIFGIQLPRFTRRLGYTNDTISNVTFESGEIIVSPSFYFEASWIEGSSETIRDVNNNNMAKVVSRLNVRLKNQFVLDEAEHIIIKVYKESGIGALCGFAPSSDYLQSQNSPYSKLTHAPFEIFTFVEELSNITESNHTILVNNTVPFTSYSGIGDGCSSLNYCNGSGVCDYCNNKCVCFDGYGSPTDLITKGGGVNPDCSSKVCPYGNAIVDVATSQYQAHHPAECSNMGLCDRNTGLCNCFAPFTGSACERLACPNNCSGHGQCVRIADIAKVQALESSYTISQYTTVSSKGEVRVVQQEPSTVEYGTAQNLTTGAWDYNVMYGCVCDSSWPVGYEAGQRQLSEYFGADCSLKHCRSGDDPFTGLRETDCYGINQNLNDPKGIGLYENICQIDCSNRGICNYKTGLCSCFEDSWGDNCGLIANAGNSQIFPGAPQNLSYYVQNN